MKNLIVCLFKKISFGFLFFIFGLLFFQNQIWANDPVNLYFFYGDGCPHCKKELSFFETEVLPNYYDKIIIYSYEIYNNRDNARIFNEILEKFDIKMGGVPLTIIGDEVIVGFGNEKTTGKEIVERLNFCFNNQCDDTASEIINPSKENLVVGSHKEKESNNLKANNTSEENSENVDDLGLINEVETEEESNNLEKNTIEVPFVGEVDLTNASLPFITFIIALMDGFNPCALWILIFLITALINMKDKRKLLILGSTFIVTSGVFYFLFLAAWFNFFKFVGYIPIINLIIGLVAMVTGIIHLFNGLKKDQSCHVTNLKQRQSIMKRIERIAKENSLLLSIIGIILLAISVNFIELLCSAGLPAVYTKLLAEANLSLIHYYLYLIFYILIFLADNLIVFFIAVKTFHVTGLTNKFSKYFGIIGGIIMLGIGVYLIADPLRNIIRAIALNITKYL